MKRLILLFIMALSAFCSFTAMAKGNGFPKGEHHNLNILGKSADFMVMEGEELTDYDNVVFILEYNEEGTKSTVTYKYNADHEETMLMVTDHFAEGFDFEYVDENTPVGDPAEVVLPYNERGYMVYARILAKPNNAMSGGPSTITSEEIVLLGVFNSDGEFEEMSLGFERFASTGKGRGRSKAEDTSGQWTWDGVVYDITEFDLASPGDGIVNQADLDAFNAIHETTYGEGAATEEEALEAWALALGVEVSQLPDMPGGPDGELTSEDLFAYNHTMNDGDDYNSIQEMLEAKGTVEEDKFALNVSGAISVDQIFSNDGTKLLQIRFYPIPEPEEPEIFE